MQLGGKLKSLKFEMLEAYFFQIHCMTPNVQF